MDFWTTISNNAAPIQTVCVVVSAIAAFLVVIDRGRISRREATIQMVRYGSLEENGKRATRSLRELLQKYEADGRSIAELGAKADVPSPDEEIVVTLINNYEMVSLGIKRDVFDEKFYKCWYFSQLLRDFDSLKPYIDAVRINYNNNAYFCEFESLAQRWKRKRHPVASPPKWKILWWIATGNTGRAMNALAPPASESAI